MLACTQEHHFKLRKSNKCHCQNRLAWQVHRANSRNLYLFRFIMPNDRNNILVLVSGDGARVLHAQSGHGFSGRQYYFGQSGMVRSAATFAGTLLYIPVGLSWVTLLFPLCCALPVEALVFGLRTRGGRECRPVPCHRTNLVAKLITLA